MHAAARDTYQKEQGAAGKPALAAVAEDAPAPKAAPTASAAPSASGGAGPGAAAALPANYQDPFPSLVDEQPSAAADSKQPAAGAGAGAAAAGDSKSKAHNTHWQLARAFLSAVSRFNASERDLHLSRAELKQCMLDAADSKSQPPTLALRSSTVQNGGEGALDREGERAGSELETQGRI